MKYVINPINNVLEVHKGKGVKIYYLSRNIVCKVESLKLGDCFNLRKKILKCISQFSLDTNMLFHYRFVFDSKFYLIIYCIKQQPEDAGILTKGDVLPVQFLINYKYGHKTTKNKIICIIYKIKSSLYIIYSRKNVILYSRIIDQQAVSSVADIIKQDVKMLNEELNGNFSCDVISNIDSLKISDFIIKYLEDNTDALSI